MSTHTEKQPKKKKQEDPGNGWWGPSVLASGLYHDGGVTTNRLGFQLARVATLHAAWRRKKLPVDPDLKEYVEAFERDGVLVMENFLPDDVFAAVKEECRRAYEAGLYGSENLDDGLVEEGVSVNTHKRDALAATWKALGENDVLRRLAAALTRREQIDRIAIEARIFTEAKNIEMPARLSGSNLLHADVHYPTAKAWLYLNDIDERNGALIYGKGTQRMTPARLRYEYEASVRVAKSRASGEYRKTISSGEARKPTQKQLDAMGYVPTSMNGKANTLVWANVQGIHARGAFEDGAVREQIQIRLHDRPPDRK